VVARAVVVSPPRVALRVRDTLPPLPRCGLELAVRDVAGFLPAEATCELLLVPLLACAPDLAVDLPAHFAVGDGLAGGAARRR
jgi:hypothetical protein